MLKILIYSNYILATTKRVGQRNVLKSLQTKGVMLFIKIPPLLEHEPSLYIIYENVR